MKEFKMRRNYLIFVVIFRHFQIYIIKFIIGIYMHILYDSQITMAVPCFLKILVAFRLNKQVMT